jgi:glycine/D-amino acid oxidase-like deaminating enzyme
MHRRAPVAQIGPSESSALQVTATALFTHVKEDAAGVLHEPEIYPRLHGDVYVCGEPDDSPVPEDPASVSVSVDACGRIIHQCSVVASCLESAEVSARQACFLPLSLDGVPLIGGVPGVAGAVVATGHSCWGILNAPATGLSVSELLLDGAASCVDLAPFALGRMR